MTDSTFRAAGYGWRLHCGRQAIDLVVADYGHDQADRHRREKQSFEHSDGMRSHEIPSVPIFCVILRQAPR